MALVHPNRIVVARRIDEATMDKTAVQRRVTTTVSGGAAIDSVSIVNNSLASPIPCRIGNDQKDARNRDMGGRATPSDRIVLCIPVSYTDVLEQDIFQVGDNYLKVVKADSPASWETCRRIECISAGPLDIQTG